MKDPYQVLGLARNASDDEIRKAYRKLARKYHPDVNPGNRQAEERFKAVSAAYDVLGDPHKRKLYDEFGEEGLRAGFDPEQARRVRQWRAGSSGQPFAGGGFDVDLEELFGGFAERRPRGPRRGEDVLGTVEIDFVDALRGTEVELRMEDGKPVRVRIPPGADDGSRLRVAGQGAPGAGGGARGDLFIETRVRPHPHFRRDGLDLVLRLPVTLDEAYVGASVEVPTPDGAVKLVIPPRSQPGARLRLRGKGVKRGSERGDLLVELDVRLPDREHAGLAAAVKAARAAYSRPVRDGLRL